MNESLEGKAAEVRRISNFRPLYLAMGATALGYLFDLGLGRENMLENCCDGLLIGVVYSYINLVRKDEEVNRKDCTIVCLAGTAGEMLRALREFH
jgi:hypothetical protein